MVLRSGYASLNQGDAGWVAGVEEALFVLAQGKVLCFCKFYWPTGLKEDIGTFSNS